MKNILFLVLVALLVVSCKQTESTNDTFPKKELIPDDIKQIIADRVSKEINQSIAIGVIDSSGIDFYSKGVLSNENDAKPNVESQYEIGSITKVFTGLLLAIKLNDGTLSLNDSIKKMLPNDIAFPDSIKNLTFEQLVTHSAGFGRNPYNLHDEGYVAKNPYAHYGPKLMYEALQSEKVRFAPGEKSQYSNFGMALLGHLLSLNDDEGGYMGSLRQHILNPLRMDNTSGDFKGKDYAQGYVFNVPVDNWDFDALSGAGVLKSSVHDILLFLQAQLKLRENSIEEEIAMSQEKIYRIDGEKSVGMAWGVYELEDGKTLYRHNGGTAGFRSFVGFTENPKKGVIVLTNSTSGVDDIGMHFLDDSYELKGEHDISISYPVSKILEESEVGNVTIKLDSLMESSKDGFNSEWPELNNLGYAYIKKGEPKKAIEVFQLNLKLHPDSADGYDSLGEAYFNAKNYQESLSNYKQALRLDPDYKNAEMMILKIDSIQKIAP